jgi:hypothetical protein
MQPLRGASLQPLQSVRGGRGLQPVQSLQPVRGISAGGGPHRRGTAGGL